MKFVRVSAITRNAEQEYLDFWMESHPNDLYRWYYHFPNQVFRVKTLKKGSRDTLRNRKREMAILCAGQLYLTGLRHVCFNDRACRNH